MLSRSTGALALLTGAVGIASERWARATRATRPERTRGLSGDEIVAAPHWQLTRGATIRAGPRDVRPWLVQMGYPPGWCTPYWFDRVRLEPPHALVLRSTTHPLPLYTDVQFGWAFVLERCGSGTRLRLRARVDRTPVWPAWVVRIFFRTVMTVGDLLEAGLMLQGIRRRAEASALAPRHRAPRCTPEEAIRCA